MTRNLFIKPIAPAVLAALLTMLCTLGYGEPNSPLREGTSISDVEGRLIKDANDSWHFEFTEKVTSTHGTLEPDQKLMLLHCSTLQKLIEDADKRVNNKYRLWARVTLYKGKNYLFPTYFLPLSRLKSAKASPENNEPDQPAGPNEPNEPDDPNRQPAITFNEPNDPLAFPEELVKKFKKKETLTPEQPAITSDLPDDNILIDRVGILNRKPTSMPTLKLTDIGRKVTKGSFRLLPCSELEELQTQSPPHLDKPKFSVAGILTHFQGKNYLLLIRSRRVYSFGNFD
jgi:hypothetical protein